MLDYAQLCYGKTSKHRISTSIAWKFAPLKGPFTYRNGDATLIHLSATSATYEHAMNGGGIIYYRATPVMIITQLGYERYKMNTVTFNLSNGTQLTTPDGYFFSSSATGAVIYANDVVLVCFADAKRRAETRGFNVYHYDKGKGYLINLKAGVK